MKNPVTEKLISAVKKKVAPAPSKAEITFLRNFYHRLSGQDFAPHKALEFRNAALRHQQLGEVRAPHKTLIEIYSLPTPQNQPNQTNQSADAQDITIINIITDDKSFLIDSLIIKLNTMYKTPHRITHPNFEVQRDNQHRTIAMSRYQGKQAKPRGTSVVECYIQFVIDFTPQNEHKSLLRELRNVIADIEIVVQDWTLMRARTLSLAQHVPVHKQKLSKLTSTVAEHGELLRWMEKDNFAFLGYAELEVTETASGSKTSVDEKSLLGIVRAVHRRDASAVIDLLPPLDYDKNPHHTSPMLFTKSRQRSTIHRANYLDCILLTHTLPHSENEPVNQRRISCILGFVASSSAMLPTEAIPHLRNKTAAIRKESTLRPGGYAYKKLHAILETLPREKLFQMDVGSLYALCMTLLNHLERRTTRVHLHRNICAHFYSCLVYIPRDLFNSTLRQRIQTFLGKYFSADEVSFNVYFSDSILTRIHYLIHCHTSSQRVVDTLKFESAIQAIARDWNDNLHECFRQQGNYEFAEQMLALYRDAFPASYQDDFSAEQAMLDIGRLAQVAPGKIHAVLSGPGSDAEQPIANFKLYSEHQSVALSDALPILENMGVRVLAERPYALRRQDKTTYWLHDFDIVCPRYPAFDATANAPNFQSTFTHAWHGNIENDGFNRLTVVAGLNWQEINLLRTVYRYLKQIRLQYSEHYIIETLANNPTLVIAIVNFFVARFQPINKGAGVRRIKNAIHRHLVEVATLDEERIIRAFFEVVDAIVRTNYYQSTEDGGAKPYLALKLAPASISGIPKPTPEYEIFVCSPRVEGTHLRGGKVARGGLRWSERPEDFRTEVLGLVKAQRVKNAVIVPVGSKGGFIVKQLPEHDREAIQQEVIACYRLFISGLLDLTDNLSGVDVIPPPEVVRMDDDDPYLVVAADKGTAAFSDIANALSQQYRFWLGDAFASGGSAGYDHKKMGITAKGAWESVKRHFRELGKNIQTTDFTVIGIGDMAGDVFGNGMLLSKHIRLMAAFNHRHIFIDPQPDAVVSYQERQRLFAIPRSSWADYDRKLLSPGGDIFTRDAKSITLSRPAKKVLGTNKDKHTPDDLINLILKAEVELLWNGGIGTYVKATTESDAMVQDKNNDGVRVNASQLRCQVVGEGGNLGMTQLARIEYALGGGLCYTDAIDNSAGVDTSDHEVNIKILLNAAIQNNLLAPKQRNELLAKMEDEVGRLVLRNNYTQTQTISREAARSNRLMPQQRRAIETLERKGLLNRALEFLPNRSTMESRREQKKWLTRPELAVLLSYSKMDMYQALLASEVPDDDYLAMEIEQYFPTLLAKKYPQLLHTHQLKREIISTQITNHLVGVMGPNFHLRLAHLSGCETAEITRAYLAARDLLGTSAIISAIESLDNAITADLQLNMLEQVTTTMQLCVFWLLRNQTTPLNIRTVVSTFLPGCNQLKLILQNAIDRDPTDTLSITLNKRCEKLQSYGIPPDIASQIAALPSLGYAVDIVALSVQCDCSLQHTAALYFKVREILCLDWLEQAIDSLPLSNDWHERARFSLGNELRASHSLIAAKALSNQDHTTTDAGLENWQAANRQCIHAIEKMTTSLKAEPAPDFAMLSVLLSELAWLH